jgi:hypothetical protein
VAIGIFVYLCIRKLKIYHKQSLMQQRRKTSKQFVSRRAAQLKI